ncbi:MAG: hypothetical protein ACLVL2_18860 [Bacteroides cellulosilyticus]
MVGPGSFPEASRERSWSEGLSGKQLYVAFATRQRPNVKLDQFALADSLGERIIPEMKERNIMRAYIQKFPGTRSCMVQ